jgi:hypothetical protein
MGFVFGRPFDVLVINRVLDETVDLDDYSLIHLIAHHHPNLRLFIATLTHICLSLTTFFAENGFDPGYIFPDGGKPSRILQTPGMMLELKVEKLLGKLGIFGL